MNFKNLTKEAKLKAFKSLVGELEIDENDIPDFELKSIGEYVPRALERIKNPKLFDGIPTGYENLDEIIGGFADEELIVVSGATGRGKTLFTQCIMINQVLQNIPLLFFTLEMSQVETTIRFMNMVKSKVSEEVLKQLPIFFYAGDIVHLKVLEEAVKKGIEQGIKAVFIDHLHFFSSGGENQSSEISHIMREIKLMARRYKIPIVLVSHIRKMNNATAMPDLDDLKDSVSISQDADTVIMINRDMNSADPHEQKTTRARVSKNRRTGKLGNAQYYLDKNFYLQEVGYETKEY